MIFYVANSCKRNKENIEKAIKTTQDLQMKDLDNCYICSLLAFSHLEFDDVSYDAEMEVCFDLISVCDKLIVVGEITKSVRQAIDFAKLIKMEVVRLGEDGELQPFTE